MGWAGPRMPAGEQANQLLMHEWSAEDDAWGQPRSSRWGAAAAPAARAPHARAPASHSAGAVAAWSQEHPQAQRAHYQALCRLATLVAQRVDSGRQGEDLVAPRPAPRHLRPAPCVNGLSALTPRA